MITMNQANAILGSVHYNDLLTEDTISGSGDGLLSGGFEPPLGEDAALVLVRLFDVLADATRLRILSLLVRYDGRMCVSEIAASFPTLRQPTISHHLQALFDAGLVKRRKSGSSVYYSADRETLSSVARSIDALLASGGNEGT